MKHKILSFNVISVVLSSTACKYSLFVLFLLSGQLSKYTIVGLIHSVGYTCVPLFIEVSHIILHFFKSTVIFFTISNGIRVPIDLLSQSLLLKRNAPNP